VSFKKKDCWEKIIPAGGPVHMLVFSGVSTMYAPYPEGPQALWVKILSPG
jgi:hypothetical protein